jgi:lysyl-tRNA synthetase class 2
MLDEIRSLRIEKLNKIKEKGINPYPAKSVFSYSVNEILVNFQKLLKRKNSLKITGRILALRSHGGSIFFDVYDGSFSEISPRHVFPRRSRGKIQAYLKRDEVGKDSFSFFEESVDIGDFVNIEGYLFLTKKKEKSVKVVSWQIVSKSIRPLPEKWHGLSDIEERFRKRYLDLLMNEEVRDRFIIKSKIIREIREFLNKEGFNEAETPILHPIAGGAIAEPFITHHNALNVNFYLRIAPELYLKRLLVGGFRKVFEIGRNFRNEGIDATHNPEFTMLELYEAYKDAEYLRKFSEKLFKTVIKKIFKQEQIEYQKEKISFSKEFRVLSFFDAIKRFALLPNPETASRDDFAIKAKQFGIEVKDSETKEKIADNIFKKVCRPKIIQPTFLINHPILISPLAKKIEGNENLADRFQLIAGGLELANGYSELNDPFEQIKRFKEQEEMRKKGDPEAAEPDWDYIEAMEYGMPPAAGLGVGIDRMVMFLTDTRNIKETILFPTLRPKLK